MVPNSLGDLTKRENRFAHVGTFPFNVAKASGVVPPQQPSVDFLLQPFNDPSRYGDDVILTNVLAFDVQVWDPNGPILLDTTNNIAIGPRDPGVFNPYPTPMTLNGTPPQQTRSSDSALIQLASYGTYADLGYSIGYTPGGAIPYPDFYSLRQQPTTPGGSTYLAPAMPANSNTLSRYTYDTWSLHYENNGVAEKGGTADQGMNGLDDNTNGVVDDLAERDTQAPFAAPFAG